MIKHFYSHSLISILVLLSFNTYAEFKSSSEASSILTGGNTELKTYLVKTENKFTRDKNIFSINGNYTYGESNNVRSAERWSLGIRYDRVLTKKIDAFIGELIESNRFAGFSRRFNTDAGLKVKLIKNEKTEAFAEAGFRYTVEKKQDPSIKDDKDSKGRAYFEIKRVLNESINSRFWIEYVPNFTTSEDYLINFEPSLSMVMNNVFSLKFAFLWNYDNQPAPGNGKHDYAYTTGIIASF